MGVGLTIERRVILAVAGLDQSVVVETDGSRAEARASGFETRFGIEDLKEIPTRRFSMFDFVRAAPGISPTSPGSVSINSVSAFGSGVNENAFLIDGTNFTSPCSGEARSEPGYDFIQEVQILSVGASVEFGNLQGGVVNVITRRAATDSCQTHRITLRPALSRANRSTWPILVRAGTPVDTSASRTTI